MKKSKIALVNSSREFNIDELFFSLTDRKGIITACNDVFVRVSGYESQDLIGEPHNCIRHPDMPRCVFKLLWDYLEKNKIIGAYVKNLAKTGEYYWVYALVAPVDEGYLSIRIKPSSKYFSVVEGLYKHLLEIEESFDNDWRAGMEESYKELSVQLSKLGFSSYDAFMGDSLREEISSRAKLVKELYVSNGKSLTQANDKSKTDYLFEKIISLVEQKNLLLDKSKHLSRFAREIELIALNSTVQASLLGRDGLPLSVIGQELSRMSNVVKSEIDTFITTTNELIDNVDTASKSISIALLQSEMSKFFVSSIAKSSINEEEQIEKLGKLVNNLVTLLDGCSKESILQAASLIKGLVGTLNNFEEFLEALSKVFKVLDFSYVAGCAEMARISREEEFRTLFEGLKGLTVGAHDALKILSSTIGGIKMSIATDVRG